MSLRNEVIKVKLLALCLTYGGLLIIMVSFHQPPHSPTNLGLHPLTTRMSQGIHSGQRPARGLRVSQAGVPAALSYLHGVSADDLATKPLA